MSGAAATAERRLAELAEEIRGHRGCGFEPCETCTNPVPGEGSATAGVLFVGEAPGAQEDRQGRPFVGSAGKLLDQLLESIGLRREDVFITNVLKARPPGNRDPKPDEIFHSWPWLKEQIELIRPRVIAPLGRHALACFLPGAKVSQDHGRAIEQAGWTYLPLYHPAAAFRVRPLRETMFADVAKLPEVLAAAPEPPVELTIEPLASKR
jgi:DNA polymerase